MADEQTADPAADGGAWRASALDVSGPGTRARGGRGDGFADTASALHGGNAGDRGTLRVEDGMLCFAGGRETWAVPLGWLGAPETDLGGVTHVELRGAGRARAIRFRLASGNDDTRELAAAIRRAHLAEPDARDKRALRELLALLGPELHRLESASTSDQIAAAATRLRSAWLPSWGAPATRLRDATAGMLTAAAEAAAGQDADAAGRFEQASARWRNVCEDLRDWCGVPQVMDLPSPQLPEGGGPTGGARRASPGDASSGGVPPNETSAAEPRAPRAAAQPSAVSITPPPAAQPQPAARQQPPPPQAPPAPPTPAVAAEPVPAAPRPEARLPTPPAPPPLVAEDDDEDEQGTVVVSARGLAPPPAAPAGRSVFEEVVPRRQAVVDDDDGEDMTVIVSPQSLHAPAPPTTPTPPPGEEEVPAAADLLPDATAYSTRVSSALSSAAPPPWQEQPAGGAPQSVVSGPGRPGSGGMTMLYRRSSVGLGGAASSVARKELRQEDARVPSVVQAFLDIGHRFRAVRHPSFVRMLEAAIEPNTGTPYIDMEFVEGESVSARQRRGPMPVEQALSIVDQLATAVDAVHAAGLIHGDVRPQNVLLEPGGRVVLLDPSVACEYTLEQGRGTIYGELPYLTPERVSGEPAVINSDIYALGTVAFALLAGRPPFNGEPAEIFAGHAEEQPPPLDEVLPGAPRTASIAIARTLAKNPNDRPASATAFAAEVRAAFAAQAMPAPPAAGPQRAPQPPAPSWNDAPQQQAAPQPPAPQQPQSPAEPPAQRRSPGPLGRGGAPSPLGRRTPPPDEPPDEDMDRTVIVRPPR